MAFDIGNGLSMMGQAISTTFGQAAIDSMRADLELQKIKLADQLAGAREDKDRAFRHEERLGSEQFTGTQNDLTRKAELDRTLITERGANARNAASVGAEYARMAFERQQGTLHIGTGGAAYSVNMFTGKSTPIIDTTTGKQLTLSDPDAKAALRASASLIDTDMQATANLIKTLQSDTTSDDYKAAIEHLNVLRKSADAIRMQLEDRNAMTPSGIDLSKFAKPAPSAPVTGAPSLTFGSPSGYNAPAPASSIFNNSGIINQR